MANRLVVRTAADPIGMSSAVGGVLHQIDPQLAVDRINSVESFERESVASPRVTTILMGSFAALAMLISASGIAAMMALAVRQRRSELGVRMALGASCGSIIWMVVRYGLTLAIVGTALGIAGAIALSRLLSTLLYATSPTDAATFIFVSSLFIVVSVVACFIPARRVTSIDPVIALRAD